MLTTDLNGNTVEAAIYTAGDGDRTELTQSINGRQVPLQKIETHAVKDAPNAQTLETLIRKYDATGQLVSTERIVVVTEKRADGEVVHATTYNTDLNGQMQETERRTIETQAHGAAATTNVTVSRPSLSGSFQVTEKRNIVAVTEGAKVKATEIVQRPGPNGDFVEAAREVKEETKAGDKLSSVTASYEPDFTGAMSLIRQQVATTTKAPDGSAVTELNVYAPSAYGIARDQNATPKLREQNVTVRREKNGVVTETTTVSRPTLQDPSRLGESTVASELVCTGKCAGSLQAVTIVSR